MISKEIAKQIADELGYGGKPIQFQCVPSIDSVVRGNLYIGYWTISASGPGASVTLILQGNIVNVMYCAVDNSTFGSTAQWFGVTDDAWQTSIATTSCVTFVGWVVRI